jgi:hypothetical protein
MRSRRLQSYWFDQLLTVRLCLVEVSMPTIEECLEHARQCEWYAARTNDEKDRKFHLRMAKHWKKLAQEKELEVRATAKTAA